MSVRCGGCGADPGVVQDLPDGGRRDLVAELDELALYSPVAPGRILRRHAEHERADRGCGGRPSRTPPAGVVPFTCDEPPVPGEQRRRGHREHLTPAVPGDQPGQRGKPQPVAWLVADLADLAAHHCVLMPEDQELGVRGYLTPGPDHQAAEHTAHEEVDDREEHSAMFPARRPARSINRAPQDNGWNRCVTRTRSGYFPPAASHAVDDSVEQLLRAGRQS